MTFLPTGQRKKFLQNSPRCKIQWKYQTLWVKIELHEAPLQAFLWNNWLVSLGGIPVRWFSGNFSLKERKMREKFVSVINNIPDTMMTEALYQHNAIHNFLTMTGIKAFKIVKNPDGTRKLLGFYETFDAQREGLDTQQAWGKNLLKWDIPPSVTKPKRNPRNRRG